MKLDEVGSQRYQAGDLDGAIAAFRQAVSLNPNDSLAYSNLGLALMERVIRLNRNLELRLVISFLLKTY